MNRPLDKDMINSLNNKMIDLIYHTPHHLFYV
jgi:hypothetical protein